MVGRSRAGRYLEGGFGCDCCTGAGGLGVELDSGMSRRDTDDAVGTNADPALEIETTAATGDVDTLVESQEWPM